MQTLTLAPAPTPVKSDADATAQLAARLARLTTQLEEAIFERDLAELRCARLAEEQRALALQPAMRRNLPPDLIQEIELARRQRAQLEHEAGLLRQQCERAEADCAHWRAEHERMEADRSHWRTEHERLAGERELLLQQLAASRAESQNLHAHAASLQESLTVLYGSRQWRFGQTVAGWFGRRWK